MKVKNIGKYHQNKIRKQALKDPVGSYFFGGFDLLPTKKQDEVKEYFKKEKLEDGITMFTLDSSNLKGVKNGE